MQLLSPFLSVLSDEGLLGNAQASRPAGREAFQLLLVKDSKRSLKSSCYVEPWKEY